MLIGYCDDLATPRTLGPFRDLVGSVGTELGQAVTDGRDRDRLLAALRAEPQVTEAFRTGAGIGWHQHDDEVFVGCERFFRPGYIANLTEAWLPALDGVTGRLRAGARVADIMGDPVGAARQVREQLAPGGLRLVPASRRDPFNLVYEARP